MSETVIDSVVFNEMRDLMDDALGAFIETYLDNTPKLLEGISQALVKGDLEAVFHASHQLKGGSGSIGAMQVFQIAKDIEERARENSSEGLNDLFSELKSAFELADTELRTHL